MKRISTIAITLVMCTTISAADAPKWLQKVRRSVVSVITYDKEGKILATGNGVVVGEGGTTVADYSIFKGAEKAMVLDADGKQHQVIAIEGANRMYEVIKFRVADAKKMPPAELAATAAEEGQNVYVLNYSTNKTQMPISGKVEQKSGAGEGFNYYTLNFANGEKNAGAPLLNEEGMLLGFVQKSTAADKNGYAIDARFGTTLQVSALSANDAALNAVNIKKALPATEGEAQLYIYMKQASLNSDQLLELRNDYIAAFPNSSEGYLERATLYIEMDRNTEADADLSKYQSLNPSKADALYNVSLLIYKKSLYKPEPAYKNWTLDEALALAERAIATSNEPLYVVHRANVFYALKHYDKAYDDYMSITTTPMRSAENFYKAALCKESLQADAKEILALKDSALSCFSKPYMKEAAPFLYARAQQRNLCKMHREAVNDFNEYEHLMNGRLNDNFYFNREQAEAACRMYKQALEDIDRCIALAPQESAYLVEKAALNLRVGEKQTAEEAARKAIEINDKQAEAYRLLGYILYNNGNKTEGMTNLNKAVELGDKAAEEIISKLK